MEIVGNRIKQVKRQMGVGQIGLLLRILVMHKSESIKKKFVVVWEMAFSSQCFTGTNFKTICFLRFNNVDQGKKYNKENIVNQNRLVKYLRS